MPYSKVDLTSRPPKDSQFRKTAFKQRLCPLQQNINCASVVLVAYSLTLTARQSDLLVTAPKSMSKGISLSKSTLNHCWMTILVNCLDFNNADSASIDCGRYT